jgi:hypothetical protein
MEETTDDMNTYQPYPIDYSGVFDDSEVEPEPDEDEDEDVNENEVEDENEDEDEIQDDWRNRAEYSMNHASLELMDALLLNDEERIAQCAAKPNINIYADHELMFTTAAVEGNVDAIKWLYNKWVEHGSPYINHRMIAEAAAQGNAPQVFDFLVELGLVEVEFYNDFYTLVFRDKVDATFNWLVKRMPACHADGINEIRRDYERSVQFEIDYPQLIHVNDDQATFKRRLDYVFSIQPIKIPETLQNRIVFEDKNKELLDYARNFFLYNEDLTTKIFTYLGYTLPKFYRMIYLPNVERMKEKRKFELQLLPPT